LGNPVRGMRVPGPGSSGYDANATDVLRMTLASGIQHT
jgi:hypothetical protein